VAVSPAVSAARLAAMGGANVMAPLGSSMLAPPGPPGALLSPSIPANVANSSGGATNHLGFPLAAPRGANRGGMPATASALGRGMRANHAASVTGVAPPRESPAKASAAVLLNSGRYMSGSETDVSTSTENLTQEERFLLRHMEREEPQGEENSDRMAALYASHPHLAPNVMAPNNAIHRQQLSLLTGGGGRNVNVRAVPAVPQGLQDELWAARLAAVSAVNAPRMAASPSVATAPRLSTPMAMPDSQLTTSPSLTHSASNSKLNPSVYSHPNAQDPLLPNRSHPLAVLGGKRENVDVTSSGASFDHKAVSKLSAVSVTAAASGSERGSHGDMMSQLTREMKQQQLHQQQQQQQQALLAPRATSISSSSGYRSDNSIGSDPKDRLLNAGVSDLLRPPAEQQHRHRGSVPTVANAIQDLAKAANQDLGSLSRSQPDLFANLEGEDLNNPHLQLEPTQATPQPVPSLRPNLAVNAINEALKNGDLEKGVDLLQGENRALRADLEELSRRASRVSSLEQEVAKVSAAYQGLLRHSERRETLEKQARQKLQSVIVNLTEVNKEVTDRHEAVMAQLLSGDPTNQNIPGLDAILRAEIARKDRLVATLVDQNKQLMAAKERQEVEVRAQQETLEEQRQHIQVLDTALSNAQAQLLRLEEENRVKDSYAERIKHMTKALEQLQGGEI